MKALAWDDEPDYLELLKKHLAPYEIDLRIVEQEDEFIREFGRQDWDFVITDLVHHGISDEGLQVWGEKDLVGERIAWGVADHPKGSNVPIFIVTNFYLHDIVKKMRLPRTAVVKSKSTHAGWMAADIYSELTQRGVYVNSRRVFLIYGRDRKADGVTQELEGFLHDKGLEVEKISGKTLTREIGEGLLEKMNACAAFVAMCTPDDEVRDQEGMRFGPRQNVLLEIGMAMGLSRGLHRLTILQKWGATQDERAYLPSDLGGVVTLRFAGDRIETVFDDLVARLLRLKVEIGTTWEG